MATSNAKALRANPTPAEIRLWRLLYPFRTNGFHFRKQSPIGPYVTDFVCHHAHLIVEADGDTHGTATGMARDGVRDAFLVENGYTVLRLSNRDILYNPEGVFAVVSNALDGRQRSGRPGARGGAGRGDENDS